MQKILAVVQELMEWEVIEILCFGCFWQNYILCPPSVLIVLKTPRLWAPCLAGMLVKLHVKNLCCSTIIDGMGSN